MFFISNEWIKIESGFFRDAAACVSPRFNYELVMICKSCLRWDCIHGFGEDLLDSLVFCSHIASPWRPFCLSWGHSSRRRFNTQEAGLRQPVRSGIPTLKSSVLFRFSFLGFSHRTRACMVMEHHNHIVQNETTFERLVLEQSISLEFNPTCDELVIIVR